MTDNSTPKGYPGAEGPKPRRSIFDDTAEFSAAAVEAGASQGDGRSAAKDAGNGDSAAVTGVSGRAAGSNAASHDEPAVDGGSVRHEPRAGQDDARESIWETEAREAAAAREAADREAADREAAAREVAAREAAAQEAAARETAAREAAAREAAARETAAREAAAREAAEREAAAREVAAREAAARENATAANTAHQVSSDDVTAAMPVVREPAVGQKPHERLTREPAPEYLPRRRAADPVSFWRRRPVLIAGIVLGGLLVLYGAAYAIAGGSLARNATVLGVEVGGLSPAEAEAKLAAELPSVVDQPIELAVEHAESTFPLVPSQAGLGVDYVATVDAIPGGSANPVSLLSAIFGGGEVAPVPSVDRAALESALETIADETDVEPVNGGLAFDDGEVVTSPAEVGRSVDVTATADQIQQAFFGDEEPPDVPIGPLTATVAEVEPTVTDADVERAVAEFAEPAMSGPVRITADEHTIDIEPEMISAALTMTPDDSGTLQPALDPDTLADAASDVLDEVGQPGREATIRIENGAPTIIPHEVGVGISSDALAEAILPVLTETGDDRAATVEYSEAEPEFTTEDAEALGVKEVVSEFTTRFPHATYRNVNIGLAASRIDDTLLKPGDEFSLNGIVGERTAANGFAKGGTISGGVLVEDYGGGVSQVATTTYHAAFKAGLEDIYHQPHSIYFDRYPVAQEATVSWGNFDMAFRNDTPYGVLVETRFTPSTSGSQGVLTVRIWSTEYFKVETPVSERSNFTDPPTVYNTKDNCIANRVGSKGFSITSYRKAWDPDGNLVKDEAYPWTYRPNPVVVCGEEPEDDD
ncbi:MAG TPA: VanW family protein [Jiangellaceae bacterium]